MNALTARLATLAALLTLSTACSPPEIAYDTSASSSSALIAAGGYGPSPTIQPPTNNSAPLQLRAGATSVAPGGFIQFSASGGMPPYRYGIASTTIGSVDEASGLFRAAQNFSGNASVFVTDGAGAVAYAATSVVGPQTAPTPTPGTFPMASANATETLSGWDASRTIDSDPASAYSSGQFFGPFPSRSLSLTAAMSSPQIVTKAFLTARTMNGANLGFPAIYDVYIQDANTYAWVGLGSYSQQPGGGGRATVTLPGAYFAIAVSIVPRQLGQDDGGRYYFQMAEVALGN